MKQSNIIGKTTLERINPTCFVGDVMRSLSFSSNLKKFVRKHPDFPTCDIVDVFEKRKYISGVAGAPCTKLLKKLICTYL